ncbi:MAG: multidrug efflux MFS transporter [Oscillospiraceae bacterium]|nr:multidrug efflux MFS transporter [Oscillospiraceae bacterium]
MEKTEVKEEVKQDKLPKGIVVAALIMALGAFPAMLDSTIVNIAINHLSQIFNTTFSMVQWVVTAYALALAVAVPFSGWIIQKIDGKKLFMGAIVLFLLASGLSATSWNIQSLIVFRIIQGFAAGILMPTVATLVIQMAGKDKLGRLMSIISIPTILGPILGPIIGGLILQGLTWHWLFLVNLPIGIVALILMQWKLPKFEPSNPSAKLDWAGIMSLSLASALLIYGITEVKSSDNSIGGIVSIIVGVALAIIYIVYAFRKKDNALIPLKLFKSKNFSASFISLFLTGFAVNGPMLLLPMFLQNIRGLSVITAALWLIPQGLGMLVTRSLTGKMTDKIGARFVAIPTILITLIGTFPFIFFDLSTSSWIVWLVLFIRGMGVGGYTIAVMSDSYTGLERSQVPQASTATRIIQNIGAAFGSAVLATMVSNYLIGKEGTIANMTSAYHVGFTASLIFMVVGVIPALFLTNKMKKKV